MSEHSAQMAKRCRRLGTWMLIPAVVALLGCASPDRHDHPRAVVESQHDARARFASVRVRLAALKARGIDPDSYHYALVQAWGDFAWDTFIQRDNSGIVYFVLRRAERQLDELERAGAPSRYVTKPIAEDVRVRRDLWQKAEQFKSHAHFRCAAARVAQLEVMLLAAGHAQQELGWRHAKPYLLAAERLERGATKRLENCVPSTISVAPKRTQVEFSRSADKIGRPATLAQPASERPADVYRDSVLFAPGSVELDPKALAVLDAVAERMRADPSIVLDLILPADPAAADDQTVIMERRVRAVREYLIDRGVGAERLKIQSSAGTKGTNAGDNSVPATARPSAQAR